MNVARSSASIFIRREYRLQFTVHIVIIHSLEGFMKVKFRQSIYAWQRQLQLLLLRGTVFNSRANQKLFREKKGQVSMPILANEASSCIGH